MSAPATTKTFSLYLAKPNITQLDSLLTDGARDLLRGTAAKRIVSNNFADEAVLFTFPGQSVKPKWVGHLATAFTVPDNLYSQSPCAVLCFRKAANRFAVSFSFGHVYLDDTKTEADFGLRVSINAVSDGKLKSLERANIGAAIRDFAQAAGQRDLATFGIDDALDLIRKISGYASDDEFADMVTGSRALRFTKKMELTDIPEAAAIAATLFASTAYRKTAFKVIDFLAPVLDLTLQDELDEKLVGTIKSDTDEFEIAIPSITPETIATYKFENANIKGYYADLSLDLYRDELGDELEKIDVETLKKHRVAGYRTSNDVLIDHWPVKTALVGSLVHKSERYALNEGQWYKVSKAYKDSAENLFSAVLAKTDKKLTPLKKIVAPKQPGKRPKISYEAEEAYNKTVAKTSGYLLMDRKLIQIDDIPGAGVEMCDLIDLTGRRFIHIKKSSRQSSVLSHFFKQGAHSAQLLRKFEPFKAALVAKVEAIHGKPSAKALAGALDDKWIIDFRIADFPRKNGEFNIPFFSKLSLRDEHTILTAMGYGVNVGFIKLAEVT